MIDILPTLALWTIVIGTALLLAFGAALLLVFVFARPIGRIFSFDFSRLNLRILALSEGLRISDSEGVGRTRERATYRILVESRDGPPRTGWVRVPTDRLDLRLDLRGGRPAIVWERPAPPTPTWQGREHPLWDNGLDGGPRA